MTGNYDRRRFLTMIGTASIATVVAGCSGDDSGDDDTPTATATPSPESNGEDFVETDTVDMTDDLRFEPPNVQISAGTTVTWENVGTIGHSVTAYEDDIPAAADYFASGGFDSQDAAKEAYPDEGNIPEGETYEHTFETTGTYEYYCIPHEFNGMVGTVTVV